MVHRRAFAVWRPRGHRRLPPPLEGVTRARVDAFHRAAIAAGGKGNGAPGLRPDDHAATTEPS
ncbi:glyoxalase/bleomycin resistance protein/dioxygenase [Paracidovorax citrulli AAC00-1]|uniref:Glyoxalase/bleomycin resistance protein/dioxygenase n=1 Tax=Paracidovorax citrulli (strain AAC00-1) TaxID=397945 RepID=A1TQB1_PARC0|nr:glyoxalase/bleomycin resistance protein/dioxygenase [Paracidovorax citrulli AAC00-1]